MLTKLKKKIFSTQGQRCNKNAQFLDKWPTDSNFKIKEVSRYDPIQLFYMVISYKHTKSKAKQNKRPPGKIKMLHLKGITSNCIKCSFCGTYEICLSNLGTNQKPTCK